jgi:DNA-binding CsgD family transcriptional regulator
MSAMVRASANLAIPDDRIDIPRRRWFVASFCKLLGEQVINGKTADAGPPLSRRERETLELLLAGNAEKQIATRLSISRHTVHVYVKSLYKRFGVNSRPELLAKWVRR